MPLVAIPNVSEGRDRALLEAMTEAIHGAGARVLDVHSDSRHNRSVFTLAALEPGRLIEAAAALAEAAAAIDLTRQHGVHPRLGGLDVCPFVAHCGARATAARAAVDTASKIADRTGLPVYLYGDAALRPETRALPDLRTGGLHRLAQRAAADLPPDFGPRVVDPARGVVCVGARPVLIAFNIWIAADVAVARAAAAAIRTSGGGLPGVRALGLEVEPGSLSEVSINLIEPAATGVDAVFAAVERECAALGAAPVRTEIVGLPPYAHMPDPDGKAARLLIKPGRCLEHALADAGLS